MTSILVLSNIEKCEARRPDDFYPTPWEPVDALVMAERDVLNFYPNIWEPACGEGHMAEVLKTHGFNIWSTDLINRGYGQDHYNFMNFTGQRAPSQFNAIITNPPFDLAEDFIRQAKRHDMRYLAMLLKAHYYHADCRIRLFADWVPSRIYPLGWRVDFTGAGAPHMDCSWYVWEAGYSKPYAAYMPPLKKPEFQGNKRLF